MKFIHGTWERVVQNLKEVVFKEGFLCLIFFDQNYHVKLEFAHIFSPIVSYVKTMFWISLVISKGWNVKKKVYRRWMLKDGNCSHIWPVLSVEFWIGGKIFRIGGRKIRLVFGGRLGPLMLKWYKGGEGLFLVQTENYISFVNTFMYVLVSASFSLIGHL